MPAVKPGATVLVTGANGYIAVWIVNYLLEKGYTVRGTVRSEEKGLHLKKLFGSYGSKLDLIYVADITAVRMSVSTPSMWTSASHKTITDGRSS